MGDVIPLFPTIVRPDCESCDFALILGNGDIHCTVYNELILEPAYSAEDCPTYEAAP